jgi:hypothetical protein
MSGDGSDAAETGGFDGLGAGENETAVCLGSAGLDPAMVAAGVDDNRGRRRNFQRTQATSALNVTIRDMTVHLIPNASGAFNAPREDTPIANATISNTPKKVTAALISASSFARFICDPSKRQRGGGCHGERLDGCVARSSCLVKVHGSAHRSARGALIARSRGPEPPAAAPPEQGSAAAHGEGTTPRRGREIIQSCPPAA